MAARGMAAWKILKIRTLEMPFPAIWALAFLTPPFLGGISVEVCKISPHNSDFL
jgi:hypothetical protein